ncbi:DNA gyrase inhibitor YacG [Inmirania thermothiophila]|uniref:DNA gyrase inhibitor YacG n=1 Tax=Inmirania thermothiophila TaxID=1750597 RepID=UPI000F46CA31|nr:DNA gyrase inhibitor YacG [Inmirania thermothiophila]
MAGHRAPTVACPRCGRPVPWEAASRWRPFCSARCRMLDLGAWLGGEHRIPGEPAPGADDGGAPPAPRD